MKRNIEKTIETWMYGVLSIMFGAAFFFGVLYSDGGISPSSYRVTESPRRMAVESAYRSRAVKCREYDVVRMLEEYERGQIRYSSFLYECMKKS